MQSTSIIAVEEREELRKCQRLDLLADETKEMSITSHSPQSGSSRNSLVIRLEELDDNTVDKFFDLDDGAVDRLLQLEKVDVSSFLPSVSPVSVDVMLLDASITKTPSETSETVKRQVSAFELPESFATSSVGKSENKSSMDTDCKKESSIICHPNSKGPLSEANIREELLDPAILDRKSADQVLRLFFSNEAHTIVKLREYWERFKEFHKIGERVSSLLNNRGVKLQRKKRMGLEVPDDEKKEIRAQRNRERSQALRRHQKQRLVGLEAIGRQLKLYNSAVRSVINCLLEDDAALPLLQVYFAQNKCSEELLAFLSHEE